MKRIFVILLIPLLNSFLGAREAKRSELPEVFKKWLEEEVVYIITPQEHDVFLRLNTDDERTLFIKAFWKQRDPTPGTPENEFKTEHYRRIDHSNKRFGLGSTRPGWQTDRGRMYIILGEPMQIENFSMQQELRDTEIWFYQDMTKYHLKQAFNLVFIRKDMASDFKLYDPARDTPYAFFPQSALGDPVDYETAYEKLREINPTIAQVSLSLIPGEGIGVSGAASLASTILLQNINRVPQTEVNDLYAEKLLKYKGLVEVEYTANYMDSDSLVQVIRDNSGTFFVHFLIEPERLSVGQFGDKYFSHFILNGIVSDSENRMIYQFDREYSIEFDKEKLESVSHTSVQLNGMFPIIPGYFKFSLILKNTVAKEFSSFERTLNVPGEITAPTMSPAILCYGAESLSGKEPSLRPFQIDDVLLFIEPSSTFANSDVLSVFFQLYGLNKPLADHGKVTFQVLHGDEVIKSFDRDTKDFGVPYSIIQDIPLATVPAGYYILKITLYDQFGTSIISQSKNFIVSPLTGIPRPLVKTLALPRKDDAIINFRLGTQYWNQGLYSRAAEEFKQAREKKPQEMDFAIALAKAYLKLERYDKVRTNLVPFLGIGKPNYDVFVLLGEVARLNGKYAEAIRYFQDTISHFGIKPDLLNSIGECYFKLNMLLEARKAWGKSLELNADQPGIKELLRTLKK